jgi:hypothetical protein
MGFLWEKRKRPLCPPLKLITKVLIPFLLLHVNDSYLVYSIYAYIITKKLNDVNPVDLKKGHFMHLLFGIDFACKRNFFIDSPRIAG